MSKSGNKSSAKSVGKKSHDEIRKARGEQPTSGADKIARRLQKRIDRLKEKGVIAAGYLQKGVTGSMVTRRQLDSAEAQFDASKKRKAAEVVAAEAAADRDFWAKYDKIGG